MFNTITRGQESSLRVTKLLKVIITGVLARQKGKILYIATYKTKQLYRHNRSTTSHDVEAQACTYKQEMATQAVC